MSENAPERIWAQKIKVNKAGAVIHTLRSTDYGPFYGSTEYVRADREAKLVDALHDAINSPKGVVPKSAEPFYDPTRCKELGYGG